MIEELPPRLAGLKVCVERVNPPVASRRFDWVAYIDDGDEHALQAYGPTPQAALDELAERWEIEHG